MTWRNWAWSGGWKWLLIAIIHIMIAMNTVILFDDNQSRTEQIVAATVIAACTLGMAAFHNLIAVRTGEVRFGFFSMYRRTLPLHEIRDVSIADEHAIRQFGGDGIKGMAKSKHGLLLGGNPSRGLRFETFDGRRYTVTFKSLDPIVQVLAQQGCTLSAGPGDEPLWKV